MIEPPKSVAYVRKAPGDLIIRRIADVHGMLPYAKPPSADETAGAVVLIEPGQLLEYEVFYLSMYHWRIITLVHEQDPVPEMERVTESEFDLTDGTYMIRVTSGTKEVVPPTKFRVAKVFRVPIPERESEDDP